MTQQMQGPTPQLLSLGINDDADLDAVLQRRPWWRRRGPIIGIAVLLLIILLGGVALALLRRPRAQNYQFQQVTQGNLSLTISATGPIQSGVYNVVFSGSGGKIDAIDVSVGQTVKQGQVLAQLDQTSLQDAVNAAQASVNAAENSLANSQSSMNDTQTQTQTSVAEAQTTLANDQTSLANTQKESQASIAAAQTTLANDQTALNNTQAQEQASITTAQTTLTNDQTALSNTQAQQQGSITAAQNTLNSDQTALTNTEAQSSAQLQVAYNTEQQSITQCQTETPTPVPSVSSCVQAAQATYQQVVASTNSANAAAQAKVNADQQALNQARTTANANDAAAQAKVTSDQQALNQTRTTANATIASAQAKVTSDQQAINQAQVQANANNAAAQAKITADQKSLAAAQAQANGTNNTAQGQVSTQQSSLQTALVQLQTAQDNLANATLKAPHGGVVTVINGTVGGSPGSSASASTTSAASGGTFIQIVDTSALQVVADVNEADTANLKVGDAVTFSVNAYGNRLFSGTVSAISPNGQTASNVVTYPVYINVDTSSSNLQGAKLLPGMTANATITVLNRTNVLLLPVNAINFARLAASASTSTTKQLISAQQALTATRAARQMLNQLEVQNPNVALDSPLPAYVLEQSGKQLVVKPVVLGLTDGTVYEVLSGLSSGETVIIGTSSGKAGSGSSGGGTFTTGG